MIFWTTQLTFYPSRVLTQIRAVWQVFSRASPPTRWPMQRLRPAWRLIAPTSLPLKSLPTYIRAVMLEGRWWRRRKSERVIMQRNKNKRLMLQNERLRKRRQQLRERSARPRIRKRTRQCRKSSWRSDTSMKRKRRPRARWRTRRARSRSLSLRKTDTRRRAKNRDLRQKRPRNVSHPATSHPSLPSRLCPSCQWWMDPHPNTAWTTEVVVWVDSSLRWVMETTVGETWWTTMVVATEGDLPCPLIMAMARWCQGGCEVICKVVCKVECKVVCMVVCMVACKEATTVGLTTIDHIIIITEETYRKGLCESNIYLATPSL